MQAKQPQAKQPQAKQPQAKQPMQAKQMMQRYTPPKPAPLPEDFDEFYASLSDQEKELHQLAIEMLGTSYFVQWCHMYRKWVDKKKEKESNH